MASERLLCTGRCTTPCQICSQYTYGSNLPGSDRVTASEANKWMAQYLNNPLGYAMNANEVRPDGPVDRWNRAMTSQSPRTPLSEYSIDDLYAELKSRSSVDRLRILNGAYTDEELNAEAHARGYVMASKVLIDELYSRAAKAKKPDPPRDKFYVSNPETYHSDWD